MSRERFWDRSRLFYIVALHTQHICHRLRGFPLCRCGHMGVSIQGEPGGEVTEHAADGLDVDAVLESQGGEGVS